MFEQLKIRKSINFVKNKINFLSNKIKNLPKKYIKVFFILILSFLSVVIFINKEKFSPDYIGIFLEDFLAGLKHGKGYPYKITGNKVSNENFKNCDNKLFLISDTTLLVLNSSAGEIQKRQHSYQNPIIKVNNNRSIVYDLGGNNLEIISRSRTLNSLKTNNNIISAAVSKYGTFAIVTEFKNFLSQMTVFDKNNKNIYYKYDFADHYITDVAINDDGKSVAVCGTTAEEGSLISTVYIFDDYKNKEPKIKFNYDNNMLLKVEYLSNGNILAIGDKLTSVINCKNCSKNDYFYNNKNLIGFDINKKNGVLLALSLSDDGSNPEIIMINKNGKVDKTFHIDHAIKSISFNNGRIAVLSYEKAYIYNFFGKELKEIDVGIDAKNIQLNSSKEMYVLGVNEIRKVRF